MKHHLFEGRLVVEYFFEDWEEGIIDGKMTSGRTLCINPRTKEQFYEHLSKYESDKIREKQKKIFHSLVKERFDSLRKDFENALSKSENKPIFIEREIQDYESLLLNKGKARENRFNTTKYNSLYPKYYDELIVKGNKPYYLIDNRTVGFGGNFLYDYIHVEAIHKLLIELKGLSSQQGERQKSNLPETEVSKKIKQLKSIWLAEPKIMVEDFIQKGTDKGIWNEDLKILTQKGSCYATGKTLLGAIVIAFRGWAIPKSTNYKEVGRVLCNVFNIEIKDSIKEPYKAFSSGNQKIIFEIKQTFGVKNNS